MVQCFQGGSKSCLDKNLPLELPFMARENNLRIQRVTQPLLLPVPQTIWSMGRHASGFCRMLATEGKMLKLGRCSLMCLRRGPKSTGDTKHICVWCSPYFTPSHVPTTYSPERASCASGSQGLAGCNSSCCGMLPAACLQSPPELSMWPIHRSPSSVLMTSAVTYLLELTAKSQSSWSSPATWSHAHW